MIGRIYSVKKIWKKIIIMMIIVSLIFSIVFYKLNEYCDKNVERLDLENVYSIEIILSNGFQCNEKITIKDTDTLEEFMECFNSIDLIELSSDFSPNFTDECIGVYIQGDSIGTITVYGCYLTIRPQNADDCVYTRYYMYHSGSSIITGNNDASIFLKGLLDKYSGSNKSNLGNTAQLPSSEKYGIIGVWKHN